MNSISTGPSLHRNKRHIYAVISATSFLAPPSGSSCIVHFIFRSCRSPGPEGNPVRNRGWPGFRCAGVARMRFLTDAAQHSISIYRLLYTVKEEAFVYNSIRCSAAHAKSIQTASSLPKNVFRPTNARFGDASVSADLAEIFSKMQLDMS